MSKYLKLCVFMTLCLCAFLLTPTLSHRERGRGEGGVGFDEKSGQYVPLDLTFLDENGKRVSLGEVIDGKPAILSLVYYECPGICTPLLGGISEVVGKMKLIPGKDFTLITISFNEMDTPELARSKKKNYFSAMKKEIPENGWRFLTGDAAAISKLTSSVGFKYKKEGKDFVHPAGVMAVSPEGKIARYLYGITFLPFDVQMALTEASSGKAGPAISKVMRICFSYDPAGRKYVFNILRVTGIITSFVIITMFLLLTIGKNKGKTA